MKQDQAVHRSEPLDKKGKRDTYIDNQINIYTDNTEKLTREETRESLKFSTATIFLMYEDDFCDRNCFGYTRE